ncbi:MAG: hypothetical protein GY733_11225 [bacterium]|nr:hypothetical protein [bacterium]
MERLGADIFSEEKGGDTDVTIPPPETLEAVRADDIAADAAPEVGAPAAGAGPESAKDRIARAFGDGVVTQKPLDEVVLEFLVDNARKRKRSSK